MSKYSNEFKLKVIEFYQKEKYWENIDNPLKCELQTTQKKGKYLCSENKKSIDKRGRKDIT